MYHITLHYRDTCQQPMPHIYLRPQTHFCITGDFCDRRSWIHPCWNSADWRNPFRFDFSADSHAELVKTSRGIENIQILATTIIRKKLVISRYPPHRHTQTHFFIHIATCCLLYIFIFALPKMSDYFTIFPLDFFGIQHRFSINLLR